MSLLVEYHLKDGQSDAQKNALRTFTTSLRQEGCDGFSYTAFSTEDPNRFLALFEFSDEDGKQRFLKSAAFAAYRDGAGPRFTGPPSTTPLTLVASTRNA
jgi:quinol monooxygenase YgiN